MSIEEEVSKGHTDREDLGASITRRSFHYSNSFREILDSNCWYFVCAPPYTFGNFTILSPNTTKLCQQYILFPSLSIGIKDLHLTTCNMIFWNLSSLFDRVWIDYCSCKMIRCNEWRVFTLKQNIHKNYLYL